MRSAAGAPQVSAGAQIEIGAVRAYQWTIRPVIGAHCRFWPSCSEYAIEALRTHGAVRGTVLAAKRILRCNPWHEGGVDLVPPGDRHGGEATEAEETAGEAAGHEAAGADQNRRDGNGRAGQQNMGH